MKKSKHLRVSFKPGAIKNPDFWSNILRETLQAGQNQERPGAYECLETLMSAEKESPAYAAAFDNFDAAQSKLPLDEARAVIREAMTYCTPDDKAHLRNVLDDIACLKGEIKREPVCDNVVTLKRVREAKPLPVMDFAAS